ncbi:ferritin-like domain-containing protein [Natronomonas marina]|jgi:rubrerythrin|uniref:ferritin-like domain-containing protein n=1 Tax=Natronomonas marina TaxID=2961939 RepID=UPI0020C9EF5C|nr:ferritin-like domain-containing protein [Natronomonas marina]
MTDGIDGTAIADRIVAAARGELGTDTRRGVLRKSAGAGAGLLALGAGAGGAAAQDDSFEDDIAVLNYALTLEHLEDVFYRRGTEEFSKEDFREAAYDDEQDLEQYPWDMEQAYDRMVTIGEHEATHTETLTSVINDLGGDPAGELEYDFGFETVADFIGIAMVLENTGVSAYDGAIKFIESAELTQAGATIATVEARHASYLNDLNNEDPFPEAFDTTRSRSEVLDAAGGFIES